MLVLGDVWFLLEGEGIIQSGKLSTMVDLSKPHIRDIGCDTVPDLVGEGLLGIYSVGQFRADLLLQYPHIVLSLLINITGAIHELVIDCLDANYSLVVWVKTVSICFELLFDITLGFDLVAD
jgi:hypothetical protein